MIKSRGYPVRGVCMMLDEGLRNDEVVRQYVDEDVVVLEPPVDGPLGPEFLDQDGWRAVFDACFGENGGENGGGTSGSAADKKARAKERIWWPFTQHAALEGQSENSPSVSYISHRTMVRELES